MLVLSRGPGERIMIGDNIVITVVRTGDTVRLGIDAPEGVPIHREEVYRAIKGEQNDDGSRQVAGV